MTPKAVQDGRGDAETTALRVRDIQKHYHEGATRHPVLDSVGFDVRRGECVALLGRSGSGKSTLLNLLAGIDRPDAGRIELLGEPLSELMEPALTLLRRRHIGFIYQFFNLIPTLTVAENLALPLELNGLGPRERQPRIQTMLERLGLENRAETFPDQLSGGEQQRIA
ncbi:ABC transporter ATP-binding protein, partial [Afifella sp. IM 167]